MPYTQWQVIDDGHAYTASDLTTNALPPGVYELTVANGHTYWIPLENRNDEIIRFPDTVVDDVVGEIRRFWDRAESFERHGLPHKRGILLWGPPGSGKTCTLQLLTRDVVDRGGLVLLFTDPGVFMNGYRQLRTVQPDTPLVVLMEDIDEILTKSNQSRILNLLDGVESTHRVVFLATTNYPENLQARITNRPSRFDRRYLIPHPNSASRRLYLETLLRDGDTIDVDKYVRDTDDMSLAHLKELFVATVLLDMDYVETLAALRDMATKARSVDGDPIVQSAANRGFI